MNENKYVQQHPDTSDVFKVRIFLSWQWEEIFRIVVCLCSLLVLNCNDEEVESAEWWIFEMNKACVNCHHYKQISRKRGHYRPNILLRYWYPSASPVSKTEITFTFIFYKPFRASSTLSTRTPIGSSASLSTTEMPTWPASSSEINGWFFSG